MGGALLKNKKNSRRKVKLRWKCNDPSLFWHFPFVLKIKTKKNFFLVGNDLDLVILDEDLLKMSFQL